jgi:AAA+ ATPase superfamily predicted ATPase
MFEVALTKPADMFDRDEEWVALERFVQSNQRNATLGIVSGRRRQGKTFLLDAACRASDGFYFAAEQAAESEQLQHLGEAVATFLGAPAPLHFADWRQAIDALLGLGQARPMPVVLDEFPYLAKANSSLPSVIQAAFGPLHDARRESRTRLLLCGSAMSFMGGLLAGNAPLRGRAGLELVVQTLDYRLAAQFWGIDDHELALKVHAIVGGTPAYRREFVEDDVPRGGDDFDAWVLRTVLNRSSPLFREARYLLREESDIRDTGLYHSVLAAVAAGNATRGGVANFVERKAGDIGHQLAVLEDSGLLNRETDLFRATKTTYRIAEPLLTFYHAVMRAVWSELERPGSNENAWRRSQARFTTQVLGPHFEQICRIWAERFAGPEVFGGYPARVASGTVHDPDGRAAHEVDVGVVGESDGRGAPPLLSIGEAKWGEVMGLSHLNRLRHIRRLLDRNEAFNTDRTVLACYSGRGFSAELRAEAARDPAVRLVDLATLYG